uniref:Transposase (putative) gypsy type domain-containing protein n=1 Tax=Fagus sylvatica TaxID=28930 RepID=A0A2N9E3C6_FAGSY
MGKFAKLVDTEEKIVEFKKRYGIPEDVHIRYVPYGDLALVLNQDLVLPMVAIIEGGVRIPMHTFLLQFLAHFRLSPLQCAPNVFRIVMGTAVLMEKLGLDLTVHDITYVYSLQATGRDQYTLFARNAYRKLVTGLPDSSKGRDEDFLVFTGNWQNPHINCSLRPGVPEKECKYLGLYHLLAILTSFLLLKSSEAGLPIIRFPSIFDPDPKPTEDMPVQRRTVNIADVLGTSAPETSRTSPSASPLPLPPGFSQGEGVMRKKRKRGTAQDDEGCVQEGSSPPQPSKAKSPKKAKSKNNRALQKATGQIPQGRVSQDDLQQPWSCSFLLENRSVDKGDSVLKSGRGVRGGQVAEAVGKALLLPEDMKVWQEKRSKYMLENLKRDSILAVQGIFEAGNRLLETERRLNLSADEIKRLKDLESSASVRIRAAESAQKSAEAGLLNLQNQVAELQRKLDSEHKSASQVRIENSQLKEALAEAEVKADKGAQAYYDQDNAGVDDDSDLYDLAYSRQPYEVPVPEEGNELEAGEGAAGNPTVLGSPEALSEPVLVDDAKAAEDRPDDQIPAAESQEGEEGSDVDETIDVVD